MRFSRDFRVRNNGLWHYASHSGLPWCSYSGVRPTVVTATPTVSVTCLQCLALPWIDEPDEETFDYRGLECCVWRNGMGALCGYVTFESSLLPIHYVHQIHVHGGVTYTSFDLPGVATIGFDCAHSCDWIPEAVETQQHGPYRTAEFVRQQCRAMVDQVLARAPSGSTATR